METHGQRPNLATGLAGYRELLDARGARVRPSRQAGSKRLC